MPSRRRAAPRILTMQLLAYGARVSGLFCLRRRRFRTTWPSRLAIRKQAENKRPRANHILQKMSRRQLSIQTMPFRRRAAGRIPTMQCFAYGACVSDLFHLNRRRFRATGPILVAIPKQTGNTRPR